VINSLHQISAFLSEILCALLYGFKRDTSENKTAYTKNTFEPSRIDNGGFKIRVLIGSYQFVAFAKTGRNILPILKASYFRTKPTMLKALRSRGCF
jgi:uncharacterized protein YxeA